MAGNGFKFIGVPYIVEMARESFSEGVSGLSDILKTAFAAGDEVYHTDCFTSVGTPNLENFPGDVTGSIGFGVHVFARCAIFTAGVASFLRSEAD